MAMVRLPGLRDGSCGANGLACVIPVLTCAGLWLLWKVGIDKGSVSVCKATRRVYPFIRGMEE